MKPKDTSGRANAPAQDSGKARSSSAPQPLSARQERRAELRRRRATGGRAYSENRGLVDRFLGNSILLWTTVSVVVAVVVIGAAFIITRPKSYNASDFNSPLVVTPTTITSDGHTLGSANAPVTVDVYSDFRCTGCGSFYRSQEPQIIDNYVAKGTVKLVYHDYTLIDQLDASQGVDTTASRDAANAGLCAADENKFWTYHDWLFSNQSSTEDPAAYSIDRLVGMGKAAGLTSSTFESCVRDGKHDSDVAAEMSSAPSISSTPSVFVNGTQVVSKTDPVNYQPTFDEIAAVIDAALPGASASASAGS
jgi:protein-disulfide isomerase